MTYNIYWNGEYYELYIDNIFVDEFSDFEDAKIIAEENGARRKPRKIESDEGAPF